MIHYKRAFSFLSFCELTFGAAKMLQHFQDRLVIRSFGTGCYFFSLNFGPKMSCRVNPAMIAHGGAVPEGANWDRFG